MKSLPQRRTSVLLITAAILASAPVLAERYVMRTLVDENISAYAPPVIGPWADSGGHVNCTSWTPDTSTVEMGQQFLQHRQCDQVQTRTITQRRYDAATQSYQNGSTVTESRTQLVDESQPAVGVQVASSQSSASSAHAVSSSSAAETSSAPSSVHAASSSPSSVSSSVDAQSSSSSLAVSSATSSSGMSSSIASATSSSVSSEWVTAANLTGEWVDDGNVTNCSAWSPSASTIGLGVNFTQSRTCTQNQVRSITRREYNTVTGEYRNLDTIQQTGSTSVNQTQNAIGEMGQWITTDSSFTAWANVGEPEASGWYPSYNGKRADWTQTQTVVYSQERYEQKREIETNTSAYRNVGSPIRQTRTGEPIATSRLVNASGGAVSTNLGAFTQWTPASGGQTTSYVQSRSANQESSRTWTYTSGGVVIGTDLETMATTSVNETRSVDVAFSAWAANGANTGCTPWSPDVSEVTTGQAFTQTRTCTQPQSRTATHTSAGTTVYTTGQSQSVTVTESQQAVGNTGDWIASTPVYGNWVVIQRYDCDANWTPAFAQQNSSFTQSRKCKEDKTRTVQQRQYNTVTFAYRNIGAVTYENTTTTPSETRVVTLTNAPVKVYKDSYNYTPDHTTYTLSSSSTTTSFTQNYRTNYDDTQLYNFYVNSEFVYTWSRLDGTGYDNLSRTIQVTAPSTWDVSGTHYNCGTWSPADSTVMSGSSFTQTRNCTQDYSRTQTFKVSTDTAPFYTSTGIKSITEKETQTSVGTAPSTGCSFYGTASQRRDAGFTGSTYYQASNGRIYWNGQVKATIGLNLTTGSASVTDEYGPTTYSISKLVGSGLYEVCKAY